MSDSPQVPIAGNVVPTTSFVVYVGAVPFFVVARGPIAAILLVSPPAVESVSERRTTTLAVNLKLKSFDKTRSIAPYITIDSCTIAVLIKALITGSHLINCEYLLIVHDLREQNHISIIHCRKGCTLKRFL